MNRRGGRDGLFSAHVQDVSRYSADMLRGEPLPPPVFDPSNAFTKASLTSHFLPALSKYEEAYLTSRSVSVTTGIHWSYGMPKWRKGTKKSARLTLKELAGLTGAEAAAIRKMSATDRSSLVHYVFGSADMAEQVFLLGAYVGAQRDRVLGRWLGMSIIASTVPYWGTTLVEVVAGLKHHSPEFADFDPLQPFEFLSKTVGRSFETSVRVDLTKRPPFVALGGQGAATCFISADDQLASLREAYQALSVPATSPTRLKWPYRDPAYPFEVEHEPAGAGAALQAVCSRAKFGRISSMAYCVWSSGGTAEPSSNVVTKSAGLPGHTDAFPA